MQVYSCTNCSKWILCRLHSFLSCRVLYSFRFLNCCKRAFTLLTSLCSVAFDIPLVVVGTVGSVIFIVIALSALI